jgi:uncharacterized membrane protein HdeD (DUF308 family)
MTPLSPLEHPVLDLFLIGFIVATSLVAMAFFLRFWKSTSDPLFLSFAAFFAVQSITHIAVLELSHPNEGSPWIFVLRLLSILSILTAIFWKNRRHS